MVRVQRVFAAIVAAAAHVTVERQCGDDSSDARNAYADLCHAETERGDRGQRP